MQGKKQKISKKLIHKKSLKQNKIFFYITKQGGERKLLI